MRETRIPTRLQCTVLNVAIAFAIRLLLVALFLPFSALDKVLEFDGAVAQAGESFKSRPVAVLAIVVGLLIEVVMSLAILSGVADRMAAFVLAGYCGVTALLWKPFWKPGDFWTKGTSAARGLFWDFWKNFALAGGFLLITFGTGADSVDRFVAHPWSSTHPYSQTP
jgi:putative oxidoreductase